MIGSESFPCLICGKRLKRVMDDLETQPYEGIMCETSGNYGSRVFDQFDGEVIRFNICDVCFVDMGIQMRLFAAQEKIPVIVADEVRDMQVGWKHAAMPVWVPWHRDLPSVGAKIRLSVVEALEKYDELDYRFTVHRSVLESLKEDENE